MKKRLKFFIIILLLAGLFILFNRFAADFFKNTTYKISAPIQHIVWKTGDWVSDVMVLPFRFNNLLLENQRLIKENLLLKNGLVKINYLNDENAALRAALKISIEQKLQLALVDVLAKDPQGDFLVISKGKEDGLIEGLAVITAEGALVGRVEKIFDNSSEVLLITAKKSSFDIEIQQENEDILAMAKGGGGQVLFFELVPQDVVIENGYLIKTTALTGKFPKNIIIGEVSELQKGEADSFQRGRISPYFLKGRLVQLFVVINH